MGYQRRSTDDDGGAVSEPSQLLSFLVRGAATTAADLSGNSYPAPAPGPLRVTQAVIDHHEEDTDRIEASHHGQDHRGVHDGGVVRVEQHANSNGFSKHQNVVQS